MLQRQVSLARRIGALIREHEGYELLPPGISPEEIFMITMFRAKDEKLNQELTARIKATRRVYVSGSAYEGKPACRFAVSNWQVDVERDIKIVEEVLLDIWHRRDDSFAQ